MKYRYRYLILGIINAIVAGIFTFIAVRDMNIAAAFFAFVFWFFVGVYWGKDTERVKDEKSP